MYPKEERNSNKVSGVFSGGINRQFTKMMLNDVRLSMAIQIQEAISSAIHERIPKLRSGCYP